MGSTAAGAVVLHLDLDHPDILEFVEHPGLNSLGKALRQRLRQLMGFCIDDVKKAILGGIARGDIWLVKKRKDKNGDRIYGNVCLEVFLSHRAPVSSST